MLFENEEEILEKVSEEEKNIDTEQDDAAQEDNITDINDLSPKQENDIADANDLPPEIEAGQEFSKIDTDSTSTPVVEKSEEMEELKEIEEIEKPENIFKYHLVTKIN